MKKLLLVLVAFFLVATNHVNAQKVFKINHFIDSVLTLRYLRGNYDTNYVTRPQTKWTLVGRFNVAGAKIHTIACQNGQSFETELTAEKKATVTIGVSYLGLSLNLSVNPAKMLGKYRDYEIGFRSYGKRFGFDITYQDANNYEGWHETGGVRQSVTTSEDMFRLRTLNVNAYYAFNQRRFSYPAAFAHSYIQRRSAGSFLLAASGQGQHGEVNGGMTEEGVRREKMDFKMTNIALGAGYGYNYVPARSWLIHISLLPTFIVYSKSTISIDDEDVSLHHHFPEGIITARSAFVKQIGSNKFAGLSVVYNYTGTGDKDYLSIRNQKWLARLYFGVRL